MSPYKVAGSTQPERALQVAAGGQRCYVKIRYSSFALPLCPLQNFSSAAAAG
jgi:hypothetical protein